MFGGGADGIWLVVVVMCYVQAMYAAVNAFKKDPSALFASMAVPRLALTAATLGCLSLPFMNDYVDPSMPPIQLVVIWSMHIFSLSGPPLVFALFAHAEPKLPANSSSWAFAALVFLWAGSAAEIRAHFYDGWLFGAVSQWSYLHAIFSLGVTSSFACNARTLHDGVWTLRFASAIPPVTVLVYFLGHHVVAASSVKPFVWLLQTFSSAIFAHAYWIRTKTNWWALTFASVVPIVLSTIFMMKTGNQWFHILPSPCAWIGYVIPVALAAARLHGQHLTPAGARDNVKVCCVTAAFLMGTSLIHGVIFVGPLQMESHEFAAATEIVNGYGLVPLLGRRVLWTYLLAELSWRVALGRGLQQSQ